MQAKDLRTWLTNAAHVEDLALSQNLKVLATESAKQLRSLVESGEELSFELAGGEGPLTSYEPLTARFVRDHAAQLRAIDAYRAARESIEASGIATSYLEAMGVPVPPEAERRADLAVLVFLCRLWDGCSEFVHDAGRLDGTLRELNAAHAPDTGRAEVVVPLVGLQIPVSRVTLGDVNIVRADLVEVPQEAREPSSAHGADWEPVFLASAVVEVPEDPGAADGRDPVAGRFERLLSTLRIFKPGGVGLGPHAWVRAGGGDRWRRISTGAGRPRPGGYRIAEEELGDLVDLFRKLDANPRPLVELRRPLARFEAGLERRMILDSLNDHLIALRFMLEGEGVSRCGLSMRVAALCADASGRETVKESVESALSLERKMWSGEPAGGADHAPARIAGELEDLTRTILRRAVSGRLPASSLRTAADQILLGEGLAGGSATSIGETAEWEPVGGELPDGPGGDGPGGPSGGGPVAEDSGEEFGDARGTDQVMDQGETVEMVELQQQAIFAGGPVETTELERVEAAREAREDVPEEPAAETTPEAPRPRQPVELLWLEEVSAEVSESTMDFPSVSDPGEPAVVRREHDGDREPVVPKRDVAARVDFLFPKPEPTEWTVGELGYERKREAS